MPLCWPLKKDPKTKKFYNCSKGQLCPCCGCCGIGCAFCITVTPALWCDCDGPYEIPGTSGADHRDFVVCDGPLSWSGGTASMQYDFEGDQWILQTDDGEWTAPGNGGDFPSTGDWTFVDDSGAPQCSDNLNVPIIVSIKKTDRNKSCCGFPLDLAVLPATLSVSLSVSKGTGDSRGDSCCQYHTISGSMDQVGSDPSWTTLDAPGNDPLCGGIGASWCTTPDTIEYCINASVGWDARACRWVCDFLDYNSDGSFKNIYRVWGGDDPSDPTGTYNIGAIVGVAIAGGCAFLFCSGGSFTAAIAA